MKAIEKYKTLMDESYKLLQIICDNHAVMRDRLGRLDISELEECRNRLLSANIGKELEAEITDGMPDKVVLKDRIEYVRLYLSGKTDGWAPTYETYYELNVESFSIDNEELLHHVSEIRGKSWAYDALSVTEDIARLVNIQAEQLDECLKRLNTFVGAKKSGGKNNEKVPSFDDCIQYGDKEKLKQRLHELIDGKSGADVGSVLLRARHIDHYLTRNPTQAEFESEFTLIKSWTAIHNYLDEGNLNALDRANKIVIFD